MSIVKITSKIFIVHLLEEMQIFYQLNLQLEFGNITPHIPSAHTGLCIVKAAVEGMAAVIYIHLISLFIECPEERLVV